MQTLKNRRDFVKISQSGFKWVTPAFILQMGCDFRFEDVVVGYTASKKVGNAVRRNRTKRRLRALAAEVVPPKGRKGCAYVLIARQETLNRTYADMVSDLIWAMKSIHKQWDEKREDPS